MAEGGSGQEPRSSAEHSRSRRAVVVPVLLMLGIVVPTALYLVFLRPPKRERYFLDSRVRDVAILGEQIEGALQAPLDALRGASWRGKNWKEAVAQIGLEPVDWAQCKPAANDRAPVGGGGSGPPDGQEEARNCPTSSQTDPDAGLGIYVALDATSKDQPSTSATEWGTLAVNDSDIKTGALLYFRKDCADAPRGSTAPADSRTLSIGTPTPGPAATPTSTGASVGSARVCGKGRLATIVEPLITGTDVDAYDVFVADGSGRILLERGPAGIGVTRLPEASTPVANELCPNAFQGLPAVGELTQSSSVRNVLVAGSCYTLIAQPLRPARLVPETPSHGAVDDASKGAATSPWVVGVLIPKPLLEAEARAFSFGSWTTIPLLLLLILLATPALKLAFIGSRAPLKPGDVRAAFFFTIAGLGIAVVTIIGHISYAWLEARLDAQLASLSDQIRQNFADEVHRANDAVELFAAVRATKRAAAVQAAPDGAETATGYCRLPNYYRDQTCRLRKCGLTSLFTTPLLRCPPYGDDVFKPSRGKSAAETLSALENSVSDTPPAFCGQFLQSVAAEFSDPNPNPCVRVCQQLWGDGDAAGRNQGMAPLILACLAEVDPYLDMLVWSDDQGWQWEKWTAAKSVTSLISIADNQSYKDVKNGNMWTLEGGKQIVVHVQRSRNTAELVATLSRRLTDDNGKLLGGAAAVVEMTSIRTPVLPPGFGAAVVQSDGKVVVHSQRQRSLYENFFGENTEPQRIASAVASRHATFIESDYHARAHRLYVHPIESSPWTLIVYRDKELPRTLDLDVTATWLLLYLLYLGVVAAAWMVAWALVRTDGEWVWPDAEQARAYWIACMTLSALGVTNAAVILWGGDNSIGRLLMGLAGPFIAMAILALTLAPPKMENGLSAAQAKARLRLRQVAWAVVGGGTLAMALGCLLLATWSAVGNLLVVLCAACVQAAMAAPNAAARLGARLRLTPAVTVLIAGLDRLRRRWRSAYVAAGVGAIVVVGVLPSIAIYKDAFDLGIATWMHHAQLELAFALAKREDRIRDRYGSTLQPEQLEARVRSTWDVPCAHLFIDGEFGHSVHDAAPREPNWRDGIVAAVGDWTGAATLCHMAQWDDRCPLAARHVSGLLMASLPTYHPESAQLREMLFNSSSDGRWASDDFGVTVHDPRLQTHRSGMRLQRLGALPAWPVAPPSIPVVTLVLAIGAALAGAYVLMWWYANQLFDLRHAGVQASADDGTWIAGQGLLLVQPSALLRQRLDQLSGASTSEKPQPGIAYVDLQRPKPEAGPVATAEQLTIVDHLEYKIDDGPDNRTKLEFMESLLQTAGARCVVVSSLDPLQHFRHRLQSPGDSADHHYVTVEEIDRWARLLDRLLKVSLPLGGSSSTMENCVLRRIEALRTRPVADFRRMPRTYWIGSVTAAVLVRWSAAAAPQSCGATARWLKALTKECGWTPRLRGHAIEAAEIYDPPDQPLACIRDLARSHHRTLWATLTDHQKLILIHLGRYGFVNPQNWRAVSRLMEQGLVQRTPAMRLMSESFTEFVKRAEAAKDVERWEAAAGPSAWHQIRGVVVVTSVLAAVVLAQSQPELLKYLAGALTAAAAFGVALTNVLGFLRRGGTGQDAP